MDTLGLYIQVPFCASKCSFCNFSSRVVRQDVYDRYAETLAGEIQHLPEFYQSAGIARDLLKSSVDSVYFGGGTPSLLGADRMAAIVENLRRQFAWGSAVGLTLEITPGSADG